MDAGSDTEADNHSHGDHEWRSVVPSIKTRLLCPTLAQHHRQSLPQTPLFHHDVVSLDLDTRIHFIIQSVERECQWKKGFECNAGLLCISCQSLAAYPIRRSSCALFTSRQKDGMTHHVTRLSGEADKRRSVSGAGTHSGSGATFVCSRAVEDMRSLFRDMGSWMEGTAAPVSPPSLSPSSKALFS